MRPGRAGIASGLCLAIASAAAGQPRVDPVLVRMLPVDSVSLLGVRLQAIRNSEFYRQMVELRPVPPLEKFIHDTGFDPRIGVAEFLYAGTGNGRVVVARGKFAIPLKFPARQAKIIRRGPYDIWTLGNSGSCILDPTLAAAGDLASLGNALDQWMIKGRKPAVRVMDRASVVPGTSQVWGASSSFGDFVAANLTATPYGINFSKIFKTVSFATFHLDLSDGVRGELRATMSTDQDAERLRDTFRGLIGIGRLGVPENELDLLGTWDRITANNAGRIASVQIDVPAAMVPRLVRILDLAQAQAGSLRSR